MFECYFTQALVECLGLPFVSIKMLSISTNFRTVKSEKKDTSDECQNKTFTFTYIQAYIRNDNSPAKVTVKTENVHNFDIKSQVASRLAQVLILIFCRVEMHTKWNAPQFPWLLRTIFKMSRKRMHTHYTLCVSSFYRVNPF